MASFEAKKFNFGDINGGQRFENGDIPQEIAFNAPIEASAYAQDLADQALVKADQALNYAVGGNFSELPPLLAYPIGTVYIQTTNSEPAELFGGTWEKIESVFLLASGNEYLLSETGGSADAVVVSHYHQQNSNIYFNGSESDNNGRKSDAGTAYADSTLHALGNDHWLRTWSTGNTLSTGEDGIGKNMPPYEVVNMWKRVA